MSSEEKELPATRRKLQKAREEGQVAQSRDLVSALTLIAAIGYLNANLGTMLAAIRAALTLPADFHPDAVKANLRMTAQLLAESGLHFVLSLFIAVVAVAVLANMIAQSGLVISFKPVVPNFNKINPVEGFTRLFSLSKLIDLIKALFKLAILGGGGVWLLAGGINALMWVPTCGTACTGPAWVGLVKTISGLAIGVFLVNGLIDMRLQLWLFLRGQRMTKTERKQESKNQGQSPEIKRALRHVAKAARSEKKGGGVPEATLIIGDRTLAVAVRFIRGETPAPVCVGKAKGGSARRMIADADKIGVPIHFDVTFAATLFPDAKAGGFLPATSYATLAQIFKQLKIM